VFERHSQIKKIQNNIFVKGIENLLKEKNLKNLFFSPKVENNTKWKFSFFSH